MIAKNKTPDYAIACATHDYIDSNMVMWDAFEMVLGREFIFYNSSNPGTKKKYEKDVELFNGAWDMAKKADFNL